MQHKFRTSEGYQAQCMWRMPNHTVHSQMSNWLQTQPGKQTGICPRGNMACCSSDHK